MQAHISRWNTFFVAENDGKVVGCCALDIYSKRIAEMRSLVVLPDYQGMVIASKLIELCLNQAKKKRILEVITITGKDGLFRKFGFSTFNNEKIALFKLLKDR